MQAMDQPAAIRTKYQSLVEARARQRERLTKWQHALSEGARDLRDQLEVSLQVPEGLPFKDKSARRYVELLDLSGKEPVVFWGQFPPAALTSAGELVFGISIVIATDPQAAYHLTMATRYRAGVAEFCQWDREVHAPSGEGRGWVRDKAAVVDGIIDALNNYFAYDPFKGPHESPSGIGFVELN